MSCVAFKAVAVFRAIEAKAGVTVSTIGLRCAAIGYAHKLALSRQGDHLGHGLVATGGAGLDRKARQIGAHVAHAGIMRLGRTGP